MLYYLYPLREIFFPFNVLRYITFRSAGAALTALVLSFILTRRMIRIFREKGIRERVSKYIKDTHGEKEGTPTMGGAAIVLSLFVSTLLWANPLNKLVILILITLIWLGIFGIVDDMRKIKKGKGLSVREKFLIQSILGTGVGIFLYFSPVKRGYETMTHLLFLKNYFLNFGIFYIPFIILVIVGTTNAVNLTDGLDGLAIGLIGILAFTFAILTYIAGHIKLSDYLNVLYIKGAGELTVFCGAVVGSALGFLWFNAHPAEIFMGDTGSLVLGGTLGVVAVLIKQEILLLIAGGVFVMETLSVILQVLFYRTKKKRIFLRAPIHHHFQLRGLSEEKIVVRFWILGILFSLVALSTLKIR
ncbi:phospho-N-acetylmuramoyl-pentapeptide-transferase [bacterium]|nr:MAG: phospho-N-acetylmuramoyl-pentapeptide-transferase [bacterium]